MGTLDGVKNGAANSENYKCLNMQIVNVLDCPCTRINCFFLVISRLYLSNGQAYGTVVIHSLSSVRHL